MAIITLSRSALHYNLDQIKTIIPLSKLSVVLKDNAYGHGLYPMAEMCREYGVKKAGVRSVEEAEKISSLFEMILVLGEVPEGEVASHIHITINCIEDLSCVKSGSSIHLKIDTGMHRHGIMESEIERALSLIQERKLHLVGVMSHARSSDELSSETYWQLENFRRVQKRIKLLIEKLEMKMPIFHFANSATLLRYKESASFDMVRIGIAMYGYSEMDELFSPLPLKSVLSLWGDKIRSFDAVENMRIGYGGSSVIKESTTLSSYDVGYSDGIFRLAPEKEFCLDRGEKIIGKISMDSFVIEGSADQVLVIGDALRWSVHLNTISYEILVKLMPHIKRVIDS